jgi:hypothetical protein
MTKKIEKLTDAQVAKFPEYVNRWLDIGLSTATVDLDNAKKSVCEAYRLAGLKEPNQFYVVDGPLAAIKKIQELDPKKKPKEIFNEMIYGSHDASWLGMYQFYRDEVALDVCNKLNGLIDLAKYSGWLNVYEDVVVFQHRPEVIKFDDQKRLHCSDGPAIKYRDGFMIYAWHGVRIPSDWIENKGKLTAKIALTWENIEQRRCACEILGWAKILKDLNSKVIDEDNDPEVGTLVEVDIPEIGREKFLRVLCGTKREFALPVPPEMKTALEANAWTFGFSSKDFVIPEVRT